MVFDVTFAALSHSLVVTPLGSALHPLDDVKSFVNRNHVQQIYYSGSKIVVEKSEERKVRL
jgi:hypothetical protein